MTTTRERRLDRTALVTGIPLLALLAAEFWTLLDRQPGGTITETGVYLLGGRYGLPWYAGVGFLAGLCGWMVVHFADPDAWRWQELIVLVIGCTLIAAWLYLIR